MTDANKIFDVEADEGEEVIIRGCRPLEPLLPPFGNEGGEAEADDDMEEVP